MHGQKQQYRLSLITTHLDIWVVMVLRQSNNPRLNVGVELHLDDSTNKQF